MAWRDAHPFAITSRFTVPVAGPYNLHATWTSHTVAGALASAWIVVNGVTVASAAIDGFAGTAHGTPAPSGSQPTALCEAFGLQLAAGTTVDIVTLPESSAGNLAVTALLSAATVVAESTPTVVIREFAADNRYGPTDADGDASDWIEIYNGTGSNGTAGYMNLTAGSPNGPATATPPAELSFSVPSGLFSDTIQVGITGHGAHTVRYTTNGTEPTLTNGLTYSGHLPSDRVPPCAPVLLPTPSPARSPRRPTAASAAPRNTALTRPPSPARCRCW